MTDDLSPTARALLALELIQNAPGITAARLGERLGVTERAARRYVAILREADLPIESVRGPFGGYYLGRGVRLPPLVFTAAEALGLVMAVLEGHPSAADPGDLVGGGLAKITRALPERVAGPAQAVRKVSEGRSTPAAVADHDLVTQLLEACSATRPLRLDYRVSGRPEDNPGVTTAVAATAAGTETGGATKTRSSMMDVEPWAVVLRHSRWYLLCWSRSRRARRVLRVDRIAAAEPLRGSFTPPTGLDALATVEDHFSQGWTHLVDVVVDAPVEQTARWLPRSLARLEPEDDHRTRLRATTDDPDWYAQRLALIPVPFRVLGGPELRAAVAALGNRLAAAAGTDPSGSADQVGPVLEEGPST